MVDQATVAHQERLEELHEEAAAHHGRMANAMEDLRDKFVAWMDRVDPEHGVLKAAADKKIGGLPADKSAPGAAADDKKAAGK